MLLTGSTLLFVDSVFVTNVRGAPLKRAGLDYETIHAEMPRLIFAQLSAWGQSGPMSENPGYDAGAFWAATGLQDYMRTDEGAQPPRFPGGIGDHSASMHLFAGVALALYHRRSSGEGSLVDANLLRAGLWVSLRPPPPAANIRLAGTWQNVPSLDHVPSHVSLDQGMGTPLMSKLGSSKVMAAGPDSHVPARNARLSVRREPFRRESQSAGCLLLLQRDQLRLQSLLLPTRRT